jgi:hypothetical protein
MGCRRIILWVDAQEQFRRVVHFFVETDRGIGEIPQGVNGFALGLQGERIKKEVKNR